MNWHNTNINLHITTSKIFLSYYKNNFFKCGNYSCIETCSLALHSNSLELAHTLSHSLTLVRLPVGSHYLTLEKTHSHSLALAHNNKNNNDNNNTAAKQTAFCFAASAVAQG